MKKVLNVGSSTKSSHPLPPEYSDFQNVSLDIDSRCLPDIICDARNLKTLAPKQFDAVYCSHNLEHYYRHDVPKVLAGFLHVLKDNGFAQIIVPDIDAVMRITIAKGLDIDDVLYQSAAGPIRVLDVLYGHCDAIEQSGKDYYAHKTGFTRKSLFEALQRARFYKIYTMVGSLQISSISFKGEPDVSDLKLFNLPDR